MRRRFNPQLALGATPIETIIFNPRSRDDIPKILRGWQHIYTNSGIRDAVFEILSQQIGKDVDFNNGRPGMDRWVLFVLGNVRLGLGCDYDRLRELVNEHKTLRALLGHGGLFEEAPQYNVQTLKDKVSLLTQERLNKINTIVVESGYDLVKKRG